MAVVNIENPKMMDAARSIYKISDLVAGYEVLGEQFNKIVDDDMYDAWVQKFKPRLLGADERIKEQDYATPYSYYTLTPLDHLLMANIVNLNERGLILSLHYDTGELTMLPLTDWDEIIFIYFCLRTARKPIYNIDSSSIRFQDIRYG